MKNHRGILLTTVLLIAICLRINAFWDPKGYFTPWGDEKTYLGLALKIETCGFREYNLRSLDYHKKNDLFVLTLASGDPEGMMLAARNAGRFKLDDLPLHYSPPLFPFLLALSHALTADDSGYCIRVLHEKPHGAHGFSTAAVRSQFYAALVPFLASLLTVFFTYALGRYMFSKMTGILGALCMAVSPIDVLAAHRVWSDTLIALLATVAMLLFCLSLKKKNPSLLWLAALPCALALLTKNNAVVLVAIIVVLLVCLRFGVIRPADVELPSAKHMQALGLFVLAVVLIALPWHIQVYRHFGHCFHNPSAPGISQISAFFHWINERPWYTYLVDMPYQNPSFLAGYAMVAIVVARRCRGCSLGQCAVVFWLLFFGVIVTLYTHADEMTGPDERYMLPAYPALCLLSAEAILLFRASLAGLGGLRRVIALSGLYMVVGLALLRSGLLALDAVARHTDFIPLPF